METSKFHFLSVRLDDGTMVTCHVSPVTDSILVLVDGYFNTIMPLEEFFDNWLGCGQSFLDVVLRCALVDQDGRASNL